MKKKIELIIIFIITLISMMDYCISYAAFADFSDEDAKKTTEEMVNEQKQNFDATKSSNNYLQSLNVEGYNLTPEFDKQILEYSINISSNKNEITITAKSDDENAKIEGIGKIKLQNNQTECRIDVTAESGTVRTYIVKLNSQQEKENSITENIEKVEEVAELENNELLSNESEEESKIDYKYIIILGIVIILIFVITVNVKGKKTHKAKRRK